MLRLDTTRNQLLVADITLSILMCSLSMGSLISSMFGMNLRSDLELKVSRPLRSCFTHFLDEFKQKGGLLVTSTAIVVLVLLCSLGTIYLFYRLGILPFIWVPPKERLGEENSQSEQLIERQPTEKYHQIGWRERKTGGDYDLLSVRDLPDEIVVTEDFDTPPRL
jgi:hypothetical protein